MITITGRHFTNADIYRVAISSNPAGELHFISIRQHAACFVPIMHVKHALCISILCRVENNFCNQFSPDEVWTLVDYIVHDLILSFSSN